MSLLKFILLMWGKSVFRFINQIYLQIQKNRRNIPLRRFYRKIHLLPYECPPNAGEYQVTVTFSEDNYYRSASDTKTFTISKAANSWEEPLSIKGWTYGGYDDAINAPTAKAKYGTVGFTYSYSENGIYTSNIPANAGTWYVKASVKAENYADLEEAVSFMIEKAIPEPEPITGLTIGKGQALKEARLPKGFVWEDETIVAGTLGKQEYKAIYTPEDTDNYETVEVMIEVEVVSFKMPVNHDPAISEGEAKPDAEKGSGVEASGSVETGDQTKIGLYLTVLVMSGLLIAVLILRKQRKA